MTKGSIGSPEFNLWSVVRKSGTHSYSFSFDHPFPGYRCPTLALRVWPTGTGFSIEADTTQGTSEDIKEPSNVSTDDGLARVLRGLRLGYMERWDIRFKERRIMEENVAFMESLVLASTAVDKDPGPDSETTPVPTLSDTLAISPSGTWRGLGESPYSEEEHAEDRSSDFNSDAATTIV